MFFEAFRVARHSIYLGASGQHKDCQEVMGGVKAHREADHGAGANRVLPVAGTLAFLEALSGLRRSGLLQPLRSGVMQRTRVVSLQIPKAPGRRVPGPSTHRASGRRLGLRTPAQHQVHAPCQGLQPMCQPDLPNALSLSWTASCSELAGKQRPPNVRDQASADC